ncbi:MAG: glycoside hydrolase family 130 protein [Clostridia bacterium]|nr:glycoside hydrolase family 130 protein [Clostridia bacterium]
MKIVNGENIPNLPWEERPEGCTDVVWRSAKNPIITRDAIKNSNSIFNSAVVPFNGGFAGVFRSDDTTRRQALHVGFSSDGVNWDINDDPIRFLDKDGNVNEFEYGYDPRVCRIEDKYYVTWCNGFKRFPTIGIAHTTDFKNFYQYENAFLPFNRNGVLFPRKINGNFAMLSRPSDRGHTPFGDMFYSESPDMTFWGKHRHVMGPTTNWQSTKIGGGPVPIETDEGWLIIYHGVLTSCNGFVYSAGAAILDLDEPWKVKYRTKPYIIAPRELYETVGDVPNVVFPCTNLCDAQTGRITIYYGAADTVIGMAYTTVDELVKFVKENS